MRGRWVGAALGVAGVIGAAAAAIGQAPVSVVQFTPTGDVVAPGQVSIRFSQPMVAFGDPSLPSPFARTCAPGEGRWVDPSTYSFDFARPLPGGIDCAFTLRADLRAADGRAAAGGRFAFTTGGPRIEAVAPYGGGEVEEDQIFLIAMNAPALVSTVADSAACVIDGVGEAVPLDRLPDATRDALIHDGAGADWRIGDVLTEAGWRVAEGAGAEPPRRRLPMAAVKCRRALPAGGRVTLVWGAGITSPGGVATREPQRFEYRVREAFRASFQCSRVNPQAGCSPVERFRLRFTAPVPAEQAMAARLLRERGGVLSPEPVKGEGQVSAIEFKGPFTPSSTYRLALPPDLADISGRPLTNAARFPLEVRTDEAPPLVKFAGTFGILELGEGGVLPVTVRNVEAGLGGRMVSAGPVPGRAVRVEGDGAVADWLRRLEAAEERTYVEEPIAGSKETQRRETTRTAPVIPADARARALLVPNEGGPQSFEVVGIPLRDPGFYVVELASPRLGQALIGPRATRYVATGALVTDLAVHLQWGKERSLVWVTRLSDGRPASGAEVRVTNSCDGQVLAEGRTDAEGRLIISGDLGEPAGYGECGADYGTPPIMASARLGRDYSFTLSSWNRGIQPGDFNLPTGWDWQRTAYATVFDRTLIRAGDTIHMKHIVRDRTDGGFAAPSLPSGPWTMTVRHLGSDASWTQPLAMAPTGVALADWASPKEAAQGDYQVEIKAAGETSAHLSGRFVVSEFRLPTMKAAVSGPDRPLVRPESVPVDLSLAYLAGGAAGGAPVTLRTIVQPREDTPSGFEGYSFGGEPVTEGRAPADAPPPEGEAMRAQVTPVTLSAEGSARVAAGPLTPVNRASVLIAEMDYDDANGERLTASARIPLHPAALRVGIASDGWMARSDAVPLKFVVLDLENRPVAGRPVAVALYSRETYSYRKRLIGGYYAYDSTIETRRLEAGCETVTDTRGRATCMIDAGVSGEVIAVATVRDARGNESRASRSLWLAGEDDWWFGGDNGDRMDVIAEEPEYAAGATARLQVRMPFREATALVTVLRDGVMDSFVTTLSGDAPIVEVPLKRGYAPNVYVSVLAVRGRVGGWRLWLAEMARRWDIGWLSQEAAQPTALVDLARPSYRLGMARLKVGWSDHRLAVAVKPERSRYRPGESAEVAFQVSAPGGRPLPADAELAVAAVDEALLGLKSNESWDLLGTMMAERPLMVQTSTAQGQVVGKRHYGRKAVAAGGGGGADGVPPRRDFEPLILWRGRVPLGADGRAVLPVRMNDSLSAFRIAAVATAGPDLFGTGEASVRTTQDLILMSGFPPVVRAGDSYAGVITARNTTDRAMPVRLSANAGGNDLPVLSAEVPPGQSRAFRYRLSVPAEGFRYSGGRAAGLLRFRATGGGGAADRLEVTQTILPAVPVETLAATMLRADQERALAVRAPAGALAGQGGVEVALSPSLAGSLAPARAWMAAYPYSCLEQQASRAVVLEDRAGWDALMAGLPRYLDGEGLARFFPGDWLEGDVVLTAYLVTLAAETGWPLPDAPRDRMLAALARAVEARGGTGRAIDEAERVTALAALARAGRAEAGMLAAIRQDPGGWPVATLAQWLDVLRRTGAAPAAVERAEAALRARLRVEGSALLIADPRVDVRLLASPDSAAAEVLLAAARTPAFAEETPRLARGLVLRMRAGRFDTTVANAMASLALRDFARRFEAEPVSGTTRLALGGTERQVDWSRGTPAPVLLPWTAGGEAGLAVRHAGTGAPWALVASRAAVPLERPVSNGLRVRREVSAVSRAERGRWTRGDVLAVRITVEALADTGWAVIDDPVPAGATILGGGLGGRSELLGAGEEPAGGPQPAWIERRQDAARAYYATLPRGTAVFEYRYRLGSSGRFQLPPTRVEALYVPGMAARLPNPPLEVGG